MTEAQIKELIATALSEFSTRFAALETAHASALADINSKLTELGAQLTAAKTELNAKFNDDNKRTELAAQVVAREFTKAIGAPVGPRVDGGGGPSTTPTAEEKLVTEFDAKLTSHFGTTKRKDRAWQLAIKESPAGYKAFLAAKRVASFDAKPAAA